MFSKTPSAFVVNLAPSAGIRYVAERRPIDANNSQREEV
jgi:hypothetical protein